MDEADLDLIVLNVASEHVRTTSAADAGTVIIDKALKSTVKIYDVQFQGL